MYCNALRRCSDRACAKTGVCACVLQFSQEARGPGDSGGLTHAHIHYCLTYITVRWVYCAACCCPVYLVFLVYDCMCVFGAPHPFATVWECATTTAPPLCKCVKQQGHSTDIATGTRLACRHRGRSAVCRIASRCRCSLRRLPKMCRAAPRPAVRSARFPCAGYS